MAAELKENVDSFIVIIISLKELPWNGQIFNNGILLAMA